MSSWGSLIHHFPSCESLRSNLSTTRARWCPKRATVQTGNRKAVGTEHLCAEPLVLDRRRQVRLDGPDIAEGQLEDVSRRRGAPRSMPSLTMQQKRGFLLRAGQGNTEIVGFALTEHRDLNDRLEYPFDLIVRERFRIDGMDPLGGLIRQKELYCPDAIPPDVAQQVPGGRAF